MDKDRTLTHYQQVGLQNPKWAESKIMLIFGEVGVVTCGKNVKLGDCGISMLFVGHAENQSSDCYRMWNPTSWKVTKSCDIIWLHCMQYQDDITVDMAML